MGIEIDSIIFDDEPSEKIIKIFRDKLISYQEPLNEEFEIVFFNNYLDFLS